MTELQASLEQVWRDELATTPAWSLVLSTNTVSIEIDADRPYSGASMIKTFLLDLVRRAVAAGDLAWSQDVVVSTRHVAYGDGVLRSWGPGEQALPLSAVCHLMVTLSDNTATNAVVDTLGGTTRCNDAMESLGHRSRLRSWVGGAYPDPRNAAWLSDPALPTRAGMSVVIPHEHAAVVDEVWADDDCRRILQAQQDFRSLGRHVEPAAGFGFKTGTVAGVRHAGGRLDVGDDTLRVTCFTDGPDRGEATDDPACIAMGRAMRRTLLLLGWEQVLVPLPS